MPWPNYILSAGAPGDGGDYSTMSAWEAQTQNDWGANSGNAPVTLDCRAGNYGGVDGQLDDRMDIFGWVPEPTALNNVTIQAEAGSEHNGVLLSDGGSGFKISNGSAATIGLYNEYITLSGIEIENTGTSGGVIGVFLEARGNSTTAQDLLITTLANDAINLASDNNTVRSNLVRYIGSLAAYAVNESGTSAGNTIENNTVISDRNDIAVLSRGANIWKNNVVISQAANPWFVSGVNAASTNNGTSGANAADVPGDNSVTGVVLTAGVDFVDPAANDYNIIASPGKLDGSGTTQSFDDIAGNPNTSQIGAYALAGAAPGGTVTFTGPDITDLEMEGTEGVEYNAPLSPLMADRFTVTGTGPLVFDEFTDAPGTPLTSHTPNVGGPWLVASGDWEIQNNRLQVSNLPVDVNFGFGRAVIEAGQSDVEITVDVIVNTVGSPRMIARWQNADNHWLFLMDTNSNAFTLYEVTNGSFIHKGQTPYTFNTGVTYACKITAEGTNLNFLVDGGSLLNYGEATAHQTQTSHGLGNYRGSGYGPYEEFDNYTVNTYP